MDVLTKEQRSYCMSCIRKTDTTPELVVRRIVHQLGFRFRLHRRNLPGCPDIVLPRHKKVIFVHGCWWHRHNCKLGKRKPKTKLDYWIPKLQGNKERHKKNLIKLRRQGWKVFTVWECQVKDTKKLTQMLQKFFSS